MPLIHDRRLRSEAPVRAVIAAVFRRFDFLQIISILVLMTTGILFVRGIGLQIGGEFVGFHYARQIQWGGIGLLCWLFFSLIDYRKLGLLFLPLYPFVIALLVSLFFFGTTHYGATRWMSIAGYSIQPSEITKAAVIGMISWYLSRKEVSINKPWHLLAVLLMTLVPMFLIAWQPNYGTAIVIGLCIAAITFTARLKLLYPLLLSVILLASAPLVYKYVLKDYHRERIAAFLNPEAHRDGKAWNQIQSKLAVGSGGFSGKGFMKGTQNEYGWLPQTVSDSDFIFSVIAEETGFAGSALLIFTYTILLISAFRCAMVSRDDFGRYLSAGIGTMIGIHVCVNIGMNIGLLPVAGLPLPLVSYGGTFMLVTLSSLGILQSVYAHRPSPEELEQEETF